MISPSKHNGLNPCFSGGWSRSMLYGVYNQISRRRLNPCFSGGWSRRATFGSVCQRDCCNDIFNFVNVWRPKICTFSGVITDANLQIFFVNWAFVPPKISAFLMAFSVILSDGVGRGDSERGRVVVRL